VSVGIARGGCRGRGGGESGRRRARSPTPTTTRTGESRVVAHRVVQLGLGEEGLGGEVELLAARAHAVHVASDVPERRAEHAAQPGVRPREPRATPGEIEGGRRRGRLLVRHARRRARRRRRGPESGSQRAAHLDALQRAACAPGTSGAARARATPKSVPPAQRAFARPCETGAGRVDRRASRSSKSAHCRSSVSLRAQPEESRRDAFVSYYRARLDVASPRLACLVSALRSIHVSPLAPSVVGVTRCVSRQRPGTLSTPSRRPGANPSPPVADSGGYKSPPRNPPGVPWPPRPRARSSCCRFRTPS